jgi:hypothetical protein
MREDRNEARRVLLGRVWASLSAPESSES